VVAVAVPSMPVVARQPQSSSADEASGPHGLLTTGSDNID
jgi:hypothetical protein